MNNIRDTKYDEILDTHIYCIVIALQKELENDLFDCHFWDNHHGDFKQGFLGMAFNEKQFLSAEKYLFNFINVECDLLINMYEEEWAEFDKLARIKEITERMLLNCDDEEVVDFANKFLVILNKAIELHTYVGFCF